MIGFAKENQRNGIIRLWAEAFGDSEETICRFLDNICKNNIVVYTQNDDVIGMASVLPVSCKEEKGRYVYAVATAKSHMGQGICRKIMAFIEEFAKNMGESFLILVPADESLFDFYKKMGYNQTVFASKPYEAETGEIISAEEYYNIRENALRNFDFIKWSKADLEFILSHGKAVKTKNGAVYIENERVIEAIVPHLEVGNDPFALIKYTKDLKFEKPYFGLAMS